MNVKELKSKVKELRNEAASLETAFNNAAIKYLDTIVGVASCESDDKNGKACLEEILPYYNDEDDLVTIEYIIMDKYGDFVEFKTIHVSPLEIDKYILMN